MLGGKPPRMVGFPPVENAALHGIPEAHSIQELLFMSQKVLVIGSNSFSGASFVRFLLGQPGLEVLGISRSAEPALPFAPHYWSAAAGGSKFSFRQLDLRNDVDAIAALAADAGVSYVVN
ncbi:MAG: hypothetical protein EBS01_13400, partial [Verrucomicrobia bacterium]|nr:hypothetical protein [Verrucomicrobiota bacterium]